MDEATTKRSVLGFSSLLVVGFSYCNEIPSALKSQLQEQFHRLPTSYSLSSVLSMILPLLGGVVIDKVSVHIVAVVLTGLVLTGQVISAHSSTSMDFHLILLGRVLVGLGGEVLKVALAKFVVSVFDPSELAFAFGVTSSVVMLASILNDKWSPWIGDDYNETSALWVGVGVSAISFAASLVLCRFKMPSTSATDERVSCQAVRRISWIFWLIVVKFFAVGCMRPFTNTASSIFLERDFFQKPPLPCQRCGFGEFSTYCNRISPHCPSVPPYAWPLPQLSKNCSIVTADDQYLCSVAPPFLDERDINCSEKQWRYGPCTLQYCAAKIQAQQAAADVLSISRTIQTLLGPLAGAFVDWFGLRPHALFVAESAAAVAHVLIGFSRVSALIPVLLLGASSCFIGSTISSAIPLLVPADAIGTAFGLVSVAQNLASAIVSLVVSESYSNAGSHYLPQVQTLFIAFGVVNAALALVLVAMDAMGGYRLSHFPEKLSDDDKLPLRQ